jgi:hypothetical protein
MTAINPLQSRRVLIVARQSDRFFSCWMNTLQSFGLDVHFFPLDVARSYPDVSNVTIHRLSAPLRPRLMLRILLNAPDQLRYFPNYEGHLTRNFHSEFVYPLFHIELPSRPAAPISGLLRNTGSATDIRPSALARVIRRFKPDLVLSVGFDHAALVTLHARDRFGPGFPAWLACAWRDESLKSEPCEVRPSELVRIFSSIDFFAFESEAELTCARKLGWTGPALPVTSPPQFDFDQLAFKMPFPPSKRRTIVIDCRAERPDAVLAAIRALETRAEVLQNYLTVVCGPPHAMIDEAVAQVLRQDRFPIMREKELSRHCAPELLGSSRIYFGIPHRDDEPDSALLYAAAMGAFPVQIGASADASWPASGMDGLSVAPGDADGLTSIVTRVLADDALVDRAAEKNLAIARQKFSVNSPDAIHRQRRELFDEIFVGPRAVR